MHDESKQPTFDRPFPALTPAQRFHFEVNGYVIIENTLSAAEVAALKSPIYCLLQGGPKNEKEEVAGCLMDKARVDTDHALNRLQYPEPRIMGFNI